VLSTFAELDLHPEKVTDTTVGYLYEDLVRRFSELSGDTLLARCPPSA
jgi:type I restriction enzyme M protein